MKAFNIVQYQTVDGNFHDTAEDAGREELTNLLNNAFKFTGRPSDIAKAKIRMAEMVNREFGSLAGFFRSYEAVKKG